MLDSSVLVAGGVLLLLCVVLAIALLRTRARGRRDLEAARAETIALRHQIEEIERVLAALPRPTPRVQETYTITGVGEPAAPASTAPAPRIDQALFADLVLRETVVRAASLAHGVRRALAPEVRNRVRFEVKREIRRARKQRRADLKEARRDWEARQRASLEDHDPGRTATDHSNANDNDENAA